MGSGKTTIGKQLASQLKIQFMDQDHEIEKIMGMEVNKIFEVHGETFFRETENRLLSEFALKENIVISTGGGTPCFYNNMDIMNNSGTTIYLKADPKALVSRLKDSGDTRPLINGKSEDELLNFVKQKLSEREKFYLKAQLTVNAINLKAEDIITLFKSIHL